MTLSIHTNFELLGSSSNIQTRRRRIRKSRCHGFNSWAGFASAGTGFICDMSVKYRNRATVHWLSANTTMCTRCTWQTISHLWSLYKNFRSKHSLTAVRMANMRIQKQGKTSNLKKTALLPPAACVGVTAQQAQTSLCPTCATCCEVLYFAVGGPFTARQATPKCTSTLTKAGHNTV